MKLTFAAAVWCVLSTGVVAKAIRGSVVHSNFPDPSLIQVEGTYYAFATANGNPPNIHAQVASSTDFKIWELHNQYDALPVMPDWADATPHVWSPDVNQLDDGTFIMYFSALYKKKLQKQIRKHHCIGAAISPNVTGPYTPLDKPFFCNTTVGGAIDPDGFVDPATGYRYVIYKVDGNSLGTTSCLQDIDPTPLQLQRVADDGYTPIASAVDLLMNTPYDGPDIEAPSLVFNQGVYYLMHNSGCYVSPGYTINYAVSHSGIEGPYVKSSRPLVVSDTILESTSMYAPGGIDVDPTNGTKVVFHSDINLEWFTHPRKVARDRAMFAAELVFDGEFLKLKAFS